MEMNFESLRNLHGCAHDLLESPNTRQALIHHRHEQWVDEICEGSLRLLDICGVTRDVLLLVKQHLQDLQSALRRRCVGDFGVERRITNSRIPIKKIMRKLVKCLEALRGMEVKDSDDPLSLSEDVDQNVMVVVIVIREMRMNTIDVVELILSYLSISKPKMKPIRQFLFLNCMRGKRVANASSEGMGYESFGMKMEESASKRLQCLEAAVEGFLVESDCMFRRLIQTRVSLLNILNN